MSRVHGDELLDQVQYHGLHHEAAHERHAHKDDRIPGGPSSPLPVRAPARGEKQVGAIGDEDVEDHEPELEACAAPQWSPAVARPKRVRHGATAANSAIVAANVSEASTHMARPGGMSAYISSLSLNGCLCICLGLGLCLCLCLCMSASV